MAVNAKFKVQQITPNHGYECDEVLLVPDYAQGRNKDWAAATPSGTIRLSVGQSTAAREFFEPGKSVTVTFEEDYTETGGAMRSGDGVQRIDVTK